MAREWTREEIVSFIKKELLLERLGLASTGTTLEEIDDHTPLFDELGIDSVTALDLLTEVERAFDIRLPELTQPFIARTCKNVRCLADFIETSRRQTGAAGG